MPFSGRSPNLISKRPTSLNMPKRPSSSCLPIHTRPPAVGKAAFQVQSNTDMINETETKKKKILHSPEWNVAEDMNSLPEVPFLHIPSTTYTIVSEENPRIVARRIVDAVASMSAVGNYNDKKAIASIYTIADVRLSIQLFKHETNKILVEIYRLSGDTIRYHYSAREILQAAKNSSFAKSIPAPIQTEQTRLRPAPTVTITPDRSLLRAFPFTDTPTRSTNEGESDVFTGLMENVQTLLRKDRIDASVLGMESLQLLTNRSSSNQHIALESSKAVVLDAYRGLQDIKNMIFGTIMDHTEDHSPTSYNLDRNLDAVSAEHGVKLKLALTIIGNALNVLCLEENEMQSLVDVEEMKELMGALREIIKEGDSNIQLVYQAARCLSQIMDLSDEMKSTAAALGMAEVMSCYLEGEAVHQLLTYVSEKIVRSLGELKVDK